MRAGAIVVFTTTSSTGCGGPTPPPFRPVVDTKLLMHRLTADIFNLFDEAVSDIDYYFASRLPANRSKG